jgi:hypothetical protein
VDGYIVEVPLSPDEVEELRERKEREYQLKAEWEEEERRTFREAYRKTKATCGNFAEKDDHEVLSSAELGDARGIGEGPDGSLPTPTVGEIKSFKSDVSNPIDPYDHDDSFVTPSPSNLTSTEPPEPARKSISIWQPLSPSASAVSPSPIIDMNTEDFVMLRRRKSPLHSDDILDSLPPAATTSTPKPKGKATAKTKPKGATKGKGRGKSKPPTTTETTKPGERSTGNRWVRFLDVGLSCPSDESADELAFCKPR